MTTTCAMASLLGCAFLLGAREVTAFVPQRIFPKPTSIRLHAAVIEAPPFLVVDRDQDGQEGGDEALYTYSGFQVDMLETFKIWAAEENITLDVRLTLSPLQNYGRTLDLIAEDCNATALPEARSDCQTFDLVVADYYATPNRHRRVDLSASWLTSHVSTMKYLQKTGPDFTTLSEASKGRATVCLLVDTVVPDIIRPKYPNLNTVECSLAGCIEKLKSEECALYVSDELQLFYASKLDPSLEVTREQFATQYINWAWRHALDPAVKFYMKNWMYRAIEEGLLDDLFSKYLKKELCPVGSAGVNCTLPCDPDHGTSDALGECICISSRWTGDDCSVEVQENKNLIPFPLKVISYVMVAINFSVVAICALWLFDKQQTAHVKVAQPIFLCTVLLGCFISTSTIIALVQEDDGDGPVPGCMAMPWLYSVGFSITFGTLFAKIYRIHKLFESAIRYERKVVTAKETFICIGAGLMVDVIILLVWTIVDPLHWRRDDIDEDIFGNVLASEGYCYSDHWFVFGGLIALWHFVLLLAGCYLCYISRDIPTTFSEGKYVAIAMVSNLQIFVVGVPVLVIVGTDPGTSTFVRSVIVWMNDLVVVGLIFGNLMYHVYYDTPEPAKDPSFHGSVHSTCSVQKRVTEATLLGDAIRQMGQAQGRPTFEAPSYASGHASGRSSYGTSCFKDDRARISKGANNRFSEKLRMSALKRMQSKQLEDSSTSFTQNTGLESTSLGHLFPGEEGVDDVDCESNLSPPNAIESPSVQEEPMAPPLQRTSSTGCLLLPSEMTSADAIATPRRIDDVFRSSM